MSERVEVDKETLQILFDIATGSLDFGSGFLDVDDVRALRAVATLLGVNPDDGTPGSFLSTGEVCRPENSFSGSAGAHEWVHQASNGMYQCSQCKAWRSPSDLLENP